MIIAGKSGCSGPKCKRRVKKRQTGNDCHVTGVDDVQRGDDVEDDYDIEDDDNDVKEFYDAINLSTSMLEDVGFQRRTKS